MTGGLPKSLLDDVLSANLDRTVGDHSIPWHSTSFQS